MKKKILRWSDKEALASVIVALKEGEVVAGSSDTVIGLLADTTKKGFVALNNLKKRAEKPYLILIASADSIHAFSDLLSADAQLLIASCWPGPLTLIVKAKQSLPASMVSAQGTIALRVPCHEGLLALLPHFEGLFSTSANLSGFPVPLSRDELDPSLRDRVAYFIDDENREADAGLPSTIVDCTQQTARIVREGAYSRASLEEIVGRKL